MGGSIDTARSIEDDSILLQGAVGLIEAVHRSVAVSIRPGGVACKVLEHLFDVAIASYS